MTDNWIGFGGNIDGLLKPERKPENVKNDLLNMPLPNKKPKQRQAGEEKDFDELEERVKMQKKLIDLLLKGSKKGPLFLYDLQQRTKDIIDNREDKII